MNISGSLGMAHFHLPTNQFEHLYHAKLDFYFPWYNNLDEFQRPVILHGHGTWSI